MAKVVVILGFCLSFAAGLVIGWRAHKPGSPIGATITDLTGGGGRPAAITQPNPNAQRRGSTGWWQAELGLTADQRARMDHIWSSVAGKSRTDRDERRREYRRERDTAIADLVPASQLGEYDRIIDTYNERIAGIERESRDAYESAVEQTRQILNPDQRTRYEKLLERYHWGPGQRERHPSTRRSETRPAATESTSTPLSSTSPSSPSASSSASDAVR